jgi:hypothetical protein
MFLLRFSQELGETLIILRGVGVEKLVQAQSGFFFLGGGDKERLCFRRLTVVDVCRGFERRRTGN